MGDTSESCEKKQLIVYFDVGGVIFRILRKTIQNYPSSLLAKLVNEFPNLGYEDKPVFIDRNPKAFEWIREIYRNGNFESCIPDLSKAEIVRELDFYQLPDMSELGITHLCPDRYPIETASKLCGSLLAEELTRRDLWKSLPLYVWFYKEVKDDKRALSGDKVFLAHLQADCSRIGTPKEQSAFSDVVSRISFEADGSLWENVTSRSGNRFVVRNVINPQVYSTLQHAALEYGLRLDYPPTSVSPEEGVLVVKPKEAIDEATS